MKCVALQRVVGEFYNNATQGVAFHANEMSNSRTVGAIHASAGEQFTRIRLNFTLLV